ncbi:MAG: 50S ribosomal protein L5, partial [Actinomycetota bacterium]|nr:50S ribosomal protein L5 [Actinomycetota bacterium]
MARLKDRYREEIAPALKDRFEIQNPMRIPKLEKIVVNMGVGEASQDSRRLDGAMEDLARITGQKPQLRRARKSIAGFKIRDGMPVGARVTLRGERMWEFLDRLISIALPRVRDFRGISPRSFDGRGNFALGLREQTIFPEISYDSIDTTRGLDVAVVTTAETDEEARELL